MSFETLITWEAAPRYRLDCVKATLPFKPLIAAGAPLPAVPPKIPGSAA